MPARMLPAAALLLALGVVPAAAARVDSDLAAYEHGGGCYPLGTPTSAYDGLTLFDPEWAPVVNGTAVASTPVLVHGTVLAMHGDVGGNFPATHVRSDYVAALDLDVADQDRLATGNLARFDIAWEAGSYPEWAWASPGDRVVALGRWVFDCRRPTPIPAHCSATPSAACVVDADCRPPVCAECGGTETCEGEHFGYVAALHPPQAAATIRSSTTLLGTRVVPVTRADVVASAAGGGAGDRCVLAHQPAATDLLSVECFPLAQPIAPLNARDFEFDLPLPPRPRHAQAKWVVVPQTQAGGTTAVLAKLAITRKLRGLQPRLHVRVRLRRRVHGLLPTGYAGTILAGWTKDVTPLTHVRVTVQALVVNNALQPLGPSVPRECAVSSQPCDVEADCDPGEACLGQGAVQSWRMQAAVDGQWFALGGLQVVDPSDVIDQNVVTDVYLPADRPLHLTAHGVAEECNEARLGKSLATTVVDLGLQKTLACLQTQARSPGELDVSYPGPDFGAGPDDTMDYETISTGGDGGYCSLTTVIPCVVDDDCPPSETCVAAGGAFGLRYRIERIH